MTRWHFHQALRAVAAGGVIAYPTEAVYGLGCLPDNVIAVARILTMKQRPVHKGLILVAADMVQLDPFVRYPNATTRSRVQASWPGPVTWLVPATEFVPYWIRGRHASVAVRVSDHPAIIRLCETAGPLVSTSANPGGCPPARTARRTRVYFGAALDYILPGRVGDAGRPTEIRDAVTGRVVRE